MSALAELAPVVLFLGWAGIWMETLRRVSRSESRKVAK